MPQPGAAIDISYRTAEEFWEEIVLASAGRLEAQPSRAHAMACAIYLSHFLDWVFAAQHRESAESAAYAAFVKRHQAACAELAWLADLAGAPGRRATTLLGPTEIGAWPLELKLPDGTRRVFAEVVAKAIAYWRANR